MENRVPFPVKERKSFYHREAGSFLKRIGNTTYRVNIYFNAKDADTAQGKIMRLIKNEFTLDQAVG